MIVLFTDFGVDGPYVGQLKSVLVERAPANPVVDLMHTAPRFNVRASAHLLAAYVSVFPMGSVILGVVDPGVGSAQRQPIVATIAGRWYVGPANGLFDVLAARALEAEEEVSCWEITWRPDHLSHSFHGRDLFAPVAARLACGDEPPGEQTELLVPLSKAGDLPEVIYVDHFGNAVTGIRANSGCAVKNLKAGNQLIERATTFSDVPVGSAFFYQNANGLLEIAVNQGNAAHDLGLSIGERVFIQAEA